MDILFTSFIMQYIPVDIAEEEDLGVKGMLVEADDSIEQKPSMILPVPNLGLVVYCLFDTRSKKVV